MIHLPLFGCNISLQSFLLLQFQFHSNFRRSNEKATLQQSILTPTITPFLCRARFYQKQPKTPEQPKANFTGISLTDTPAKGALSCKP